MESLTISLFEKYFLSNITVLVVELCSFKVDFPSKNIVFNNDKFPKRMSLFKVISGVFNIGFLIKKCRLRIFDFKCGTTKILYFGNFSQLWTK